MAQLAPTAILRGHRAQVHAAVFIRNNSRLVTGDADGHVVLWDLAILRPRAVWRPHDKSILGIAEWGRDKLITHGRDNRLIVWALSPENEDALSTALPLDPHATEWPQPWMLYMLDVNTMNFCAFASCPSSPGRLPVSDELLLAVPNTLLTEAVDLFHLPSQQRKQTVKPALEKDKNGMVMALSLFHLNSVLTLVMGYENGLALVLREHAPETWSTAYSATAHTQPILSLDVSPGKEYFFTSGADAVIAKHPIPTTTTVSTPKSSSPVKVVNTKHSGQQSLRLRSDGRILATAGWDGRARVYSAKTLKELAVLKFHTTGLYAVAFASVSSPGDSTRAALTIEDATADIEATAKSDSGTAILLEDQEQNRADRQADAVGAEPQALSKLNTGQISVGNTAMPKLTVMSVKERRERDAVEKHWIAVGAKDGRITIWELY